MRNLEKRGVRACCVDWNTQNAGFTSVYGKTWKCPDPDADPDGWIDFMTELAATMDQKPVLIAASDPFVTAMARHRDTLATLYRFCAETAELQAALCSKESLYTLSEKYSFPIPNTRYISNTEELGEFARTVRSPCIMKPQQAIKWTRLASNHPMRDRKLVRATSEQDLIAKYRLTVEWTPDVVVQEEIAGPDTAKLVYLSCYSQTGERLAHSVFRERRTAPPVHFGSASMVEPVIDSETESMCDEFLRNMGYRGLCEIELKRDSQDGIVKMIEANPRYTGTSDASPYDGVDLGWIHYLDLIGHSVKPVQPLVRDFRHVMFINDLEGMSYYVDEGLETWSSIIRSYRPPVYFFDLDPRDWRNLGRTGLRVTRILAGKAYRKFFRPGKEAKRGVASSVDRLSLPQ